MRLTKFFAMAALAAAGAGCGPTQPELYRVTVSAAPLLLPGSCYASGSAPSTSDDQTTHRVEAMDWVLWAADSDEQFLAVGDIHQRLGDARPVTIFEGDAIQGEVDDKGKLVFATERTVMEGTRTFTLSATFTFAERGAVARGSVTFKSLCTGSDCLPSCEATRDFTGVRVDAQRNQLYTGSP